MSYLNTELTIALQKNKSIPEFSRRHLKVTINDPCQTELTAFLGYENTIPLVGILEIAAMAATITF